MTLIVDVSAFVSDAAITWADPTLLPVTVVAAPDAGATVATEPGVLVQLTARSVTTVPLTSVTVAVRLFVLAAPERRHRVRRGRDRHVPDRRLHRHQRIRRRSFPRSSPSTCVDPDGDGRSRVRSRPRSATAVLFDLPRDDAPRENAADRILRHRGQLRRVADEDRVGAQRRDRHAGDRHRSSP